MWPNIEDEQNFAVCTIRFARARIQIVFMTREKRFKLWSTEKYGDSKGVVNKMECILEPRDFSRDMHVWKEKLEETSH